MLLSPDFPYFHPLLPSGDGDSPVKYIQFGERGWDHRPYWQYLDSVKNSMPSHLFAFAANTENHDLGSPDSLHDAWLRSWNVVESGKGKKVARLVQIEAKFLGPQHDRFIHLTYLGVQNYETAWPGGMRKVTQIAHGDLLVHELHMISDDVFMHEMLFETGAVFRVQFSDLIHRIELTVPAGGFLPT